MKYKSKVLIVISVCVLIIGSYIKSLKIQENLDCVEQKCTQACANVPFVGRRCAPKVCVPIGLNKSCIVDKVIKPIKPQLEQPIKTITDKAAEVSNEVKSSTNKIINKINSDIATIKSSIDDLPNKVLNNNFINDMQKEIDSTFNSIIDKLKDSIDDIMGAFGKMGIIFIEIFNTFNEMVNIMKSTFNFLIGIINQLKKCNLVYIKAKPIRARFREVMSKMFELVILQIQFIQPDVILNPFLIGNYLNNISKKQIELNKIFITNLSLDWADYTKLDIKGCLSLNNFTNLGKTYIDVVKDLADKVKNLSDKTIGFIEKLKEMGVEISDQVIPINFNVLGFLKNPWTQSELDASNEENQEFQKLIMDYISKVTNKSIESVKKLAQDGASNPQKYNTTEFKQTVNT
tara:strand:+ start:364 stop:1572 length:1209 start_codon:yes stop_codon:yes gene_type:complete